MNYKNKFKTSLYVYKFRKCLFTKFIDSFSGSGECSDEISFSIKKSFRVTILLGFLVFNLVEERKHLYKLIFRHFLYRYNFL